MDEQRRRSLAALEKKALWLSTWMIHHANHVRESGDLKVGGHQASSASSATILTALYGAALRPEDRVAVKPHASPVYHALMYLFGRQTLENLKNFRGFGGAQSYPSRTKDADDVDFSTGSVGLGVAQTLFSALAQDYVRAHGWAKGRPEGRMVALVGDAEMDEGNIYEALVEGWKQGLRNCWWVIDYNRQSLDAVIREGLWERFETMFRNFGWDVVIVKYGALQRAAFDEPGGAALKQFIDDCPNQDYSALCYQGGAAWRRRLLDAIGDQGDATALVERRSDDELQALMTNLGGHDLGDLTAAFEAARAHDRPVCFICYTVKGAALPLAGHKDNHAGLLTPTQMAVFRDAQNVREGHEWELFEGLDVDPAQMRAFIEQIPFLARWPRRYRAPAIPTPARLTWTAQREMSTQAGFGALMHDLARSDHPLAARIVTTSPDVTVSTNLGPWVNRRRLFARQSMADVFKRERIPSTFSWEFAPEGQHFELGIAEMNLFLMLSALGLSHEIDGERLIPVGTLYDPFIYRGADALNYACYQDARFLLAATPSGITLAPEGGAHQSIGTPLVGMAQDGLASFEPAFVDELATIMRWSFDYIQRDGSDIPRGGSDAGDGADAGGAADAGGEGGVDRGGADGLGWLRDAKGGSVYLRLSTRTLEQPQREIDDALARDIVDGAYWMRPPGPNCALIVAYTGVVAPEAIEAVGRLAEDRRDVGLLAVTSADRLNAGWQAACVAREAGEAAQSHIERLLSAAPPGAGLVTVVDGHPATLAWLGGVRGFRTRALGVEHFGQTGTIADLYAHYGLDAAAIARAAQALDPRRPLRMAAAE